MTPNVIIDCDPGGDDAVAILLAAKHTHLHGITTVSGNVPLHHTTRNALSLIELMHADIPVHSGADKPLQAKPAHAEHVHGEHGFGDVFLPAPQTPVAGDDAAGYLIEASKAIDNLWVAAIGPLTNIALALRRDPDWAQRIAGVSIMGGSTMGGNVTAAAEFNIWADPEAAREVFQSGVPIKLSGTNLTHQLQTDDQVLERLHGGGKIAQLVAKLYDGLHQRLDLLTGERRAALHDPCAILALSHPELLTLRPLPVDVELNGELTRGMTVIDQRITPQPVDSHVEVGLTIDADAAMQVTIDTLLNYP